MGWEGNIEDVGVGRGARGVQHRGGRGRTRRAERLDRYSAGAIWMSKPRKAVVATCEIEFFVTEAGNSPVEKYIDGLSPHDAGIVIGALQGYARQRAAPGLESRPIRPPLYEFKIKQYRLLYVEFSGVIMILHAFEKQSRKTPTREIEAAVRRLKSEQARRRIH